MERALKRKLAGGATALALLGGGGGAYAIANSGSGGRDAFLNDVAKRLNVTPEKLKGALDGALADRLAADVKAGRLTQQQADEIKRHAQEHGGVPFGGPGPPPLPPFGAPGPPPPFGGPGHHGPGGPRGPVGAGIDAAAKYLGLTPLQLHRKLESGKSLAQVAADQSKDVAGLKSAIEDAVKADLDRAVADKRLTQAQEDDILKGLHDRIDELVNRKGRERPPRDARWRRGPHW